MPRYNSRGDIAAGIGGAIVSRNRQILAQPAGGAVWVDDAHVLYARKVGEPDRWGLRAHDGQTETKVEAEDTGANSLYAGGGVWAAARGPGYRSNHHPASTMRGLLGVGVDGTLAYCRDHQVGLGLWLRSRSGTERELLPESSGRGARGVHVLSATRAVWVSRDRIRSNTGDPDIPDGVCHSPRVTEGGHLLYILSDAVGERLLLQVDWDEPVGYVVLEAEPNALRAFRPDIVLVGTELRVCWSLTEGEGPANIRETTINRSRPPMPLRRPRPTPPPRPPQEPTVPLPHHAEYVAKRCRELGLGAIDGGDNDATKARTFEILNRIAAELNAMDPAIGLLEKTAGNRFKDRAIDILTWLEASGLCHHWDVIGNAEGAEGKDPTPAWRYVGPINAGRWREPYPVETVPPPPTVPNPGIPVPTPGPPVPTPPPPVPAPSDDLEPVLEGIADLLDGVAAKLSDNNAAIAATNTRLDKIEAALVALLAESRKPRPVNLHARYLGPITGTIGAP